MSQPNNFKITHRDGRYELIGRAVGPEHTRRFARANGFLELEDGRFSTVSDKVAARLRSLCDKVAEKRIQRALITVTPWTGRIGFPRRLTPKPFQLEAARFILRRNRSYLRADPGLGKTVIAALVANSGQHAAPTVYITPAQLAFNVEAELKKWCTQGQQIAIYRPDTFPAPGWREENSILIVPDSFMADPLGSHENLFMYVRLLARFEHTLLFVDEAHRFKNEESQRSRTLLRDGGWADSFSRVVLMSGTPMPSRPIELFPILNRFAPEVIDFKGRHDFGKRYCEAHWDGFGWDYKGAANVEELGERMRKAFMLKLEKKDVMSELPPKTEELVFLSDTLPPRLRSYEKKHLSALSPHDVMKRALSTKKDEDDFSVAEYRHALGIAKVPAALKFLREELEWCDSAFLVFAEHTEVIERLASGLKKFNPIVIHGKIDKKKRQELVHAFQRNTKHRVAVLNLEAGGIGYTLTKATRVVRVEASYVPGENSQAEDRAHRIGQTLPVHVQDLVFANSFDRKVIEINLRKRESIRHI